MAEENQRKKLKKNNVFLICGNIGKQIMWSFADNAEWFKMEEFVDLDDHYDKISNFSMYMYIYHNLLLFRIIFVLHNQVKKKNIFI